MSVLLDYVKKELGLVAYKESYLLRRINARMVRRGIKSEEEYLELLKSDENERRALKEALSINVTSFFRNPEVWGKLKEILKEDNTPLKAWSAACSDGREPYSLVMLCEEIGRDVKVIATDIDEEALQIARKGIYENIGLVDLEKELTAFLDDFKKYIDVRDSLYIIKPHIKRKVTFIKHDMIYDEPPAKDFDLVLCRNFLIYVEPKFKPTVAANIARAMKKGGILVLGKTENLPIEDNFEVIDRINKIYRKIV